MINPKDSRNKIILDWWDDGDRLGSILADLEFNKLMYEVKLEAHSEGGQKTKEYAVIYITGNRG